MEIDKDKMTLMRIAMRQAGNSGDIEAAYDALLRKVSSEYRETQEAPEKKTQVIVKGAEKIQKKARKAIDVLGHEECLKILEALILLDEYDPQNKTMLRAAKMVFGDKTSSSYNAGPYLLRNGYLERQGAGRYTIWTILKNPDGTPYNKNQSLTITVLPPGQAYGYGQKDDRPAFNPAYRDQTR